MDVIEWLFLVVLLVGPFTWFALKTCLYYNLKRKPFELVAVVGFFVYVAIVMLVGVDDAVRFLQDVGNGLNGRPGGMTCFAPGIGFALAAFPYQASLMSDRFVVISQHGLNGFFSFLGWLILFLVVVRHWVVLT